eukprot:c26106_g2_i1 orf=393-578(-)
MRVCIQLADPATPPKKRVATQLVKIEKEILGACLLVVNEFIDGLPYSIDAPCSGHYLPSLK